MKYFKFVFSICFYFPLGVILMIIFYIIKIRFFETKIQFTDETTIENTKFNHSFFKPFNNEPIKALIVLKDGLYGNMLLIASNKSIKIWNYKTSSIASIIPKPRLSEREGYIVKVAFE